MTARLRSPMGVWLAQLAGVLVAVFLVGYLGRVSVPPPPAASGAVLLLWTASGIALGCLLLFGNRIWPAVWLGSFLVELAATTHPGGAEAAVSAFLPEHKYILPAAVIACGMTLQAALGRWLVGRVIGNVSSIENLQQVLAVMVLGGIVSTTVGAMVRSVFGRGFALEQLNWETWQAGWCAELVGVLVFAPLPLALHYGALSALASRPRAPLAFRLRQAITTLFQWAGLSRLLEAIALFVVIPVLIIRLSLGRAADYGVILVTASALWATLRFGKLGTGLNLLLMAMIVVFNIKTGTDLVAAVKSSQSTIGTDAQILEGTFGSIFWILAAILNERERVAKALRENEARFRQFSEGMSHIIWMMTPDRQHFLYVNLAFEHIYGRKREDLYAISDIWLAGIHPEDRKRVAETRWAQIEVGEHCEEYRVIHTDGTVRWLREIAVPLRNEQGEIAMFGGTVEDITQIRQVAQELARQQSELLHVSRLSSVGQMIATLSHEVAQPMSAIGTFATVCAKHLESTPVEDLDRLDNLRQCIEAIAAENQRCRSILRRLRDFTRKNPRHRTDCDLNSVIRESIDLAQLELQRFDVKLRCELVSSPPLIEGDQIQLQQVMINLLTNARDAMLEVDPSRRIVIVHSRAIDDSMVVDVADQGIGLPAGEGTRIFEPFFTTKPDGMGIGLSICKTILEEHGGEIQAFTNESGGATFRIVLPVRNRSGEERLPQLQQA